MKKALITGISGQDGSYLAEYLLSLGYEVHGVLRRHSVAENQDQRLHAIEDKIITHYGDMLDVPSLTRIVSEVMPDEIYNLAAMSHVRISFDMPSFTIQTNAVGVLNILEVYRTVVPTAKFYQASSSEMFGNSVDEDGVQRLTTPMNPVSPYGCAKLLAFNLVKHYRNAYGLHACNGILFNHETPDEWIVSTGETWSVRDLAKYVFEKLDLDWEDYVVQNPKFMRPEELKYLKGDSERSRKVLGWEPEYTFYTMLDEMIEEWMQKI